MLKKTCLAVAALSLLLSGCGHAAPGVSAPEPTIDPYAGMVEVSSGYGTTMWVKEYEELEVNPFLGLDEAPEGYRAYAGIDVSEHQGVIDWAALCGAGKIDFAILRAGYRGYGAEGKLCRDAQFQENMSGTVENGLPVGVYFFSQAVSVEEAEEEAEYLLEILSVYSPETFALPIFYDWEDISNDTARTDDVDSATVTDCAVAFCEKIKAAGYTPGVYAYRYFAYYGYDLPRISEYSLWIGALGSEPDFYYAHDFWQFSVEETLPGIEGNVDADVWFVKDDNVLPNRSFAFDAAESELYEAGADELS